MSFILDALRKSEHDRERRALPALIDRPASSATRSRLPFVLGALGVLLLINVVVVAIALLRAPAPPPVPPANDASTTRAASPRASWPPPPASARSAGAASTRPLDAEAVEREPDGDYPEPPPARSGGEPALLASQPPLVRRAAERDDFRDNVPSINDVAGEATAGLPPLNLDLHVYADVPAQRFVVLNGQRLHEGSHLREGPVLERITPDGVVLDYRGTRFRLPRQ